MHNLDDTHPSRTRPEFEHLDFEPILNQMSHRGRPILYCQQLASPRKCVLIIKKLIGICAYKGFIDSLRVNFDIFVIFNSLFICRFFMRRKSVIRSVFIIIPLIWTVWVTSYVCTKEIYRPQRDSNPVPPGSVLPMSYPGLYTLSMTPWEALQ